MNRKQRRAEGKGGKGATSGADGQSAFFDDQVFQQALHHHQAGRAREAEAGYRSVLARNPRHAGALCYLGLLAHQSGDSDAGIDFLRKAIASDKRNADLQYNLACMLADVGRDDEAIEHNRKAVEIDPRYVAAHGNLGALLLLRGQHDAALASILRGLKIAPTTSLKSTFVLLAQSLDPATVAMSDDLAHFLTSALTEPWGRPRDICGFAIALLMRYPAIAAGVARVAPDADELIAMSRNRLLHAVLVTSPVTDAGMERLLTAMRRTFINDVASMAADDLASLAAALAQQCFINEYVFAVSDDEAAKVSALRVQAEKASVSGETLSPIALAALASYLPLHALTNANALAAREWPATLQSLIAQQIRDPKQENDIRATIENLTTLTDSVSEKVRAQYEESPYPKWTRVAADTQPVPVDHYMRMRFPGAPYKAIGNNQLNLLIAGCGTGMHAIQRAKLFANANVLAIDLSLSSLSYAIRKTREMGISNIRYAQADILEFSSDTKFDVIDSSGVLHHLKNPLDGWRRLAGMVRPGGLMHIGLYSEIARHAINVARAKFAAQGQQFSPESVRKLRAGFLALPDGDELGEVSQFSDFFSMSEFRDLLFHVQEHQFSIPQIAKILSEIGFKFIGFETQARQAYLKRFPDDPAAVDLGNWATFEIEKPATFAQMYQFWIQKT